MNIARWLDRVAKTNAFQIAVSREVAQKAGWDYKAHTLIEATDPVSGETIEIVGVARGRDLPASILSGAKAMA